MSKTWALGDLLGLSEPLQYKEDKRWVLDKCTIGIEIEVEQLNHVRNMQEPHRNDPIYDIDGLWALVSDGSLRNHGGEFVSRKLFGADLTAALQYIEKYLTTKEPKHEFSHRTSVHVHMDVRDLTWQQFQYLVQLYCIFERPLFRISGERNTNEYCIALSDSRHARRIYGNLLSPKSQLSALVNDYASTTTRANADFRRALGQHGVKYLALNLLPFSTRGSVEFRHHSGTCNFNELSKWINVLMCLKKSALDYPFKWDPYLTLSHIGPLGMLEAVFGEYAQVFGNYAGIEADLWEGCRVAQDIILSIDIAACHKAFLATNPLYKAIGNFYSKDRLNPKKEYAGQPAVEEMINEYRERIRNLRERDRAQFRIQPLEGRTGVFQANAVYTAPAPHANWIIADGVEGDEI